jgi:hypothetical protein
VRFVLVHPDIMPTTRRYQQRVSQLFSNSGSSARMVAAFVWDSARMAVAVPWWRQRPHGGGGARLAARCDDDHLPAGPKLGSESRPRC